MVRFSNYVIIFILLNNIVALSYNYLFYFFLAKPCGAMPERTKTHSTIAILMKERTNQ